MAGGGGDASTQIIHVDEFLKSTMSTSRSSSSGDCTLFLLNGSHLSYVAEEGVAKVSAFSTKPALMVIL